VLKWSKLRAQLGRKGGAPCSCNFNSGNLASGKTRVPNTSNFKAITAWWLASNLTDVTLAMKCEINGQKSQTFPNTSVDRLGKSGGYLQLGSFTFLHCTISI